MGRNGLCVWHDGKREANLAKHGLDFFDIVSVFDGRPALVRLDRRFDYGEERFNLLARLEGFIVNVTFTLRADDYHVISARLASRKERLVFDEWEKRQF
jgi:uncharacterized protein